MGERAKKRRLWLRWVGMFLLAVLILFSVASVVALRRFDAKHSSKPYSYGVSFSTDYANYLGVDPKATLRAVLTDLHPQQLRLMSYWSTVEPTPGHYDFSDLDWQFALAKKYDAKVSLAVGLRQPRYPECHFPAWTNGQSQQQIYDELIPFITTVVNRYKTSPQLQDYQLENEALLTVFGVCPKFSRAQLVKENALIQQLDPAHPVAINVSNEYGLPLRAPLGQEIGFSVYRRVFDARVTHMFVNYPFAPFWYKLRAAIIEQYLGGTVFIHELQAEPWGKKGTVDLSVAEQDQAFDVNHLRESASFARATDIKRIDFWGVEWWYYRKAHFHDDSIWDAAKDIFAHAN